MCSEDSPNSELCPVAVHGVQRTQNLPILETDRSSWPEASFIISSFETVTFRTVPEVRVREIVVTP